MTSSAVRRSVWGPGLAAITVLAYLNGLVGPLQFDDHLLDADRAAQEWAVWWDTLGRSIRPLLKASYIISRSLGEALRNIPLGHHLFSLGIHLLTVVLAYRVARYLSLIVFPSMPSTAGPAAAAGCAAVLALHPLATEAVTYISGRSVAMATLFVLAAMALHISGSREPAAGARALRMGGAAACYVAAVLIREAMIVLPAAMLFYEWSRADRPETPSSAAKLIPALRNTLIYWALAATAALWLMMHDGYENLIAVSRVIVQGRITESSLLPALEYFAERLPLLAPLSIDPDLRPQDMSWPRRLALALALATLLALAWRARRRRPYWLWGIVWIMIFLLPIYLVPLRHDPVSERHFYPALFGVGLVASMEAARIAARGKAASRFIAALSGLLIMGMLGATVIRNADYTSEVALWASAARASPGKPRVFNNLGVAYMKERRWDLAIPCFELALDSDPGYRAARENLDRAIIKLTTGNPDAEPEI
jgi:tetratricopeptide (TPR) repeat protein